MKWITSIREDGNEYKVLGWSLDTPEAMFQFQKEVVINAIENGSEYKTAYLNDGVFVEGSEVTVININGEKELRTKSNDNVKDNLNELPVYKRSLYMF